MRAALEHPPMVEHDHFVELLQLGQPVGDQQHALLARTGQQVGEDRVGGGRVEVLAWLV